MRRIKRRTVLFGLAGLSLPLIASACAGGSSDSQTTTEPASNSSAAPNGSQEAAIARIGYQRFSDLDLIRIRGVLEQSLQEQNVTTEWSFFQAGPPLLEAMNAGSLDFGGVGDAPPIFAQAAGAQFYYVGVTPRGPETQDIIVRNDSPIKTAADLAGKKVALQRGSSAHYLLVEVLREQNIPVEQVEVVSLPPADARAAFEQGTVDAWSIWDPFLAVAEATGNVKSLKVGRERRAFFLASKEFAESRPDLVKIILQAARENEQWGQQNARQIAEQFAGELDIDADILELVNQRRQWGLFPVDESVLAAQQRVADTFYEIGVIPQAIQVNEVALPERDYAQVFPVS
jgi:sulfonate transport system substrate-binding protein